MPTSSRHESPKIVHLLQCPFTGLGLHGGYRGDEWFRNRIAIFKQFVIPSLINQTNKTFFLWLNFRPEEEENPICQEFIHHLDQIRGLATVVSYGGCPFYDDKFDDEEPLLARLKIILPPLKEVVKDARWVYVTIQPSDDLYLDGAVARIQSTPPKAYRSVGFSRGYIANYHTKEIAHYDPTTNPPFYTYIVPAQVFLSPVGHWKAIKGVTSHEYVGDFFHHLDLPGREFVVGVHGENISTTWNIPFKGRQLSPAEAEKVWIQTGNFLTPPLVMPKTARVQWRERLNALPPRLRPFAKKIYYKIVERK